MSNYRQLLAVSVKVLTTFDAGSVALDAHLQNSAELDSLSDDADRIFVTEVFAGCVRYHRLIKLVVDGFYTTDGKTCLRSDYNLFCVLTYLMVFRLGELGMAHFKKLVCTQHIGKMHKFLHFFIQESNLKGWIKDEWCVVFDKTFVETTLLSPLLRFETELKEFVKQLSDLVTCSKEPKRTLKLPTEAKPFNLTKPKARTLPMPEMIPTLKAFKEVPKSTYSRPVEDELLSKARESNRKKAEENRQIAGRLQLACTNTEKSDRAKAVMQQIMKDKEAKTEYHPVKPTAIPTNLKDSLPVKLNTAAILREGFRVQRREEEEERKLASLEAGEHDDAVFLRWQEEMKNKDALERLTDTGRKHLEGQLSREEAIIARQRYIQETREKAQDAKEESRQLMQQYFSEQQGQQREMRKLVEATMAGHRNTKESRLRLQQMKQRIVQQVAKESQELMAKALEEAEAEMRRKAELIQQIRVMESTPIIRTKFVDLTETGGQGLLSEMSVVELRERLSLLKVAEAEEEEKKRKEILSAKLAKQELLNETVENVQKHRLEENRQSTQRMMEQKQIKKAHVEASNKSLSPLQEKLEAKKKERQRLEQTAEGNAANNRRKAQVMPATHESTTPISTLLRVTNRTVS